MQFRSETLILHCVSDRGGGFQRGARGGEEGHEQLGGGTHQGQHQVSPCLQDLHEEYHANCEDDERQWCSKLDLWIMQPSFANLRDLVPAGYVDYSTRAAILNAAYFKVTLTFCMLEEIKRISNACQIVSQVDFVQGDWSSQFKAEETALGNFYVKRDQIKMVNFMNQV